MPIDRVDEAEPADGLPVRKFGQASTGGRKWPIRYHSVEAATIIFDVATITTASLCASIFYQVNEGTPMNDILEKVLSSSGKDVNGARENVRHYLELLASTGKTEQQLLAFGTAYLKEILEPDPRYSGC